MRDYQYRCRYRYPCFSAPLPLLSRRTFPTRRSSDLFRAGARLPAGGLRGRRRRLRPGHPGALLELGPAAAREALLDEDRKSTRLKSSHVDISYAVISLYKKNINKAMHIINRKREEKI